MSYTIQVNGNQHVVDAEADTPLLWVLRDILDMTGTKYGCGVGPLRCMYGACKRRGRPLVHVPLERRQPPHHDDRSDRRTGRARKVQEKWLSLDVPQCGYCQGGQIMAATALLEPHAAAFRCGHRCGHVGQPVPLRLLRTDPHRDQALGETHAA